MAVEANLDIYIRAYDEVTATLKQVANDLRDLISSVKQVGTQSRTASKDVDTLADSTLKAGSAADKAADQELGFFRALEQLVGGVRNLAYAFAGLAFVKFLKDMADASARTEVLATVMYQVARNAGISKEEIDNTDKAVQKLGITAAASRQSITQLIQANIFKPEEITKYATQLARASQDLAVISGMNSSDTFARLIVNINQMDSLGLRWMGLMVDKERVFAEAVQRTGKQLDPQAKKLEFTNAVLAEAAKLAGVYELAMNDVGKQLTSLPRLLEDVRVKIGDYLLPAYSALVESLKNFLERMGEAIGANNKFSSGAQALASAVKLVSDQFFRLVEVLFALKDILLVIASLYVFDKLLAFGKAAKDIFLGFGKSIADFGNTLARISAGIGLMLGSVFGSIGTKIGAFAATLFSSLGAVVARFLPYIGSAILAFNLADYLIKGTDFEPYWQWFKSQIDNLLKQAALYYEKGKRLIGLGSDEQVVDAQIEADKAYVESLKTSEDYRKNLKVKTNTEILDSFAKSKQREIELEEQLRETTDSRTKEELTAQFATTKSANSKIQAKLNELEATGKLTEAEVKRKKAIEATDIEAVRRSRSFTELQQKVGTLVQQINADFSAVTAGVDSKVTNTVSTYTDVVSVLVEKGEEASFAVDELVTSFDGLAKKANPKELELITEAVRDLIPKVDPADADKLQKLLDVISNYRTDSLVRENEKLTLSFDRILSKLDELNTALFEQYRIASDLANSQGDLNAAIAAERGNYGALYDVENRKRQEAITYAKQDYELVKKKIDLVSGSVTKQLTFQIDQEKQAQKTILEANLKRIDDQYDAEVRRIKDKQSISFQSIPGAEPTGQEQAIDSLISARETLKKATIAEAAAKIRALDQEESLTKETIEVAKEGQREILLESLSRIDKEYDAAINRINELKAQQTRGLTEDNPLFSGFESAKTDLEDNYQKEIDNINALRKAKKEALQQDVKDSETLKRLKDQLAESEKTTNQQRIASLQQYQKKLLAALKEAEEAYKRHLANLDSLKKEQEGLALRKSRDLLELDSGTISKEEERRRNEKIYRQERTKAEVEYAKAVLKRQDSSMARAKELYEAQITDAKRLAAQAKERGDLSAFRKYRRDVEEYYSVLEKINAFQQKEEKSGLEKAKEDIADLSAEAARVTAELINTVKTLLDELGLELLIDVDSTYLQSSILLALSGQQYVIDVMARVSGLPGAASITPGSTEEPVVKLNKVKDLEGYYAGGGMVQGPGTDTSDNLLAWLSPNEFVLRAKAVKNIVREYGINTLNYINEFGRFPKFALGGLVERIRELPSLLTLPAPHLQLMAPVLAGGGPVTSAPLTPMHFHFPDAVLTAKGTPNEIDAFKRYFARENLKRGRK